MTRFFVHPDFISDGAATLGESDAHHLRTVLRAQVGDEIAILDGSGREWRAELVSLGKTRAAAKLGHESRPSTEPSMKIAVVQAIPRVAEKLEQVLQRCTEIGASAFWIYPAEKGATLPPLERREKKAFRLSEIIRSAAEQSHRAVLPTFTYCESFEEAVGLISSFEAALVLQPSPDGSSLKNALSDRPRSVALLTGPESGFTEREYEYIIQAGWRSLTLGPRILRTETAAMVAVAQTIGLCENVR